MAAPGARIGPFTVVSSLGKGGMGEVLRATVKSGVEMEGSPIEVLAENARQTEKQLFRDRVATESQIAMANYQKKQLTTQRNLGIASSVLGIGNTLAQSFGPTAGATGGRVNLGTQGPAYSAGEALA